MPDEELERLSTESPSPFSDPVPDWKFPATRNNVAPPSFDDHMRKVFAHRVGELSPAVVGLLRELWTLGVGAGSGGCETCNSLEDCEPESARTAYPWDGTGENPNRYAVLCRECAAEHHAHWDEMWAEYYASQGC
jgi:hypothetical protein